MTDTATPAIEGWFTTGPDPALVGTRCTTCGDGLLPAKAPGFCRNPACDGEEFEEAELSRRGTDLVLHRRAVPAAAAVHPAHRPVRAVRARRGRAARGAGRARPGRRRVRRRRPRGRRRGRAGRRDALRRRDRRPDDLALEAGRPRWARRPTSERPRRRRRRGRHAPVGQVGQATSSSTACTPPAPRSPTPAIAWPDVDLIVGGETVRNGYGGYVAGATFAQALGWNGARVATSYAACATGAQALDTARARILAGLSRGRAGGRRRHHAQGLPRAQRRRALGRPGLAAVPAARHDEPGVLRALRAPPDGPLRRDRRRTSPQVKVKNARHGLENPNARYRKEVSVEDVLTSAVVSDPLHLLDICATSDGAAAVVLTLDRVRRAGTAWAAAVRINAISTVTPTFPQHRDRHAATSRPTRPPPWPRRSGPSRSRSAHAAYEEAGHRPRRRRRSPRSTTCRPRSSWTGSRTSQLCKRGEAEALLRAGDTTHRRPDPGQPVRRARLLRRGGAGPGAGPGLRGDLAAARPGDRPPGRGRPGRHHRQPGPLRPRLLGDPQPLTARPSRAASRSMARRVVGDRLRRAERRAVRRQPLHQRQAVGDRALGDGVVDLEPGAGSRGRRPSRG